MQRFGLSEHVKASPTHRDRAYSQTKPMYHLTNIVGWLGFGCGFKPSWAHIRQIIGDYTNSPLPCSLEFWDYDKNGINQWCNNVTSVHCVFNTFLKAIQDHFWTVLGYTQQFISASIWMPNKVFRISMMRLNSNTNVILRNFIYLIYLNALFSCSWCIC